MNRDKGVTGPAGFRAAGIAAGIKASGAPDLTLVVNDGPNTAAAGVFTTNAVKAAPVLWSQEVLKQRSLKAVVLNSGGANACTGPEGFQDTHATAEKVAQVLACGAIEVAVCSTGLIGERLPMGNVLSGVDTAVGALAADDTAGLNAATGVMTTDTRPKQSWQAHERGWSVGGFVKGAGMLAPNLATMLSVITTDADVDKDTLDAALRAATRRTFDRLDVDGGTSTNDTVLVLASGASGVRPSAEEFTALLTEVSADLVKQLQGDAEGVTKEIAITVTGAATEDEAVHIGRIVAEDNLVKTALFGSDPNWGRIAMALGRAKARIDPDQLSIVINGIRVMDKGTRGEDRANADLSGREVDVVIELALGHGEATILTTDLSHGYVEENSAYSS
ncbi:bifunctional ornithine acetyltransferase/N-acetylglutamate synthase [Actinosynnema sp. ALI-1.44]|uniref:bifunctional glutamate N-acetyltransferase/amino-acid acetyltransferase ArgJ n=1 Tax=Actinosynnema sp. ALI-1.44 TaxID=1933779 RepID=UPI00097C369D|nr:bifunctional glutamate N-acetyltransferase/amino-acid acetyltransferase ArgJ [Actinosynnema sp. ALI-1.44]ONI79529.1 bifunctional ornithine acetyltransferase/N-acetylglutamate synthase [Actinosynnema sp. ALI-1.44]